MHNVLMDGIAEKENERSKDCLDTVYNILEK